MEEVQGQRNEVVEEREDDGQGNQASEAGGEQGQGHQNLVEEEEHRVENVPREREPGSPAFDIRIRMVYVFRLLTLASFSF